MFEAKPIEIVIPLQNPTDVLLDSVKSVAGQRSDLFCITLSDNHSETGSELIKDAIDILERSNLPLRVVRPPRMLGRVEHWNWAFHQARSEWLKPLFLGDTLFPGAIGSYFQTADGYPERRFIYSPYVYACDGQAERTIGNNWSGWNSPARMQEIVGKYGMQFGPPSGVMFRRDLFVGLGGLSPGLPICADSLLFCRMACRAGGFGLSEPFFRFHIHKARFSSSLPQKRWQTFRENVNYRSCLLYHAWTEGQPLYLGHFAKAIIAELKSAL